MPTAADLADAAGRPLSAGIPRAPGEGRFVPRSLLQSGARRRSDPAAGPAVRLRCGDPVLRHPGGAACAGTAGVVRRRGRTAARAGHRPRGSEARSLARSISKRSMPVFETIRHGARRACARTSRCSASAARRGRSRPTWWRDAARRTRRRHGFSPIAIRNCFAKLIDILVEASATIWSRSSRPASTPCRSSTPGRACWRPTSSSAGASRRRSGSLRMLRTAIPDAKIIGFPRGAGTPVDDLCGTALMSMRSGSTG